MATAVPDRWELELVIKEAGLLPDQNFFAAWRIPNDTAYGLATLADVGDTRWGPMSLTATGVLVFTPTMIALADNVTEKKILRHQITFETIRRISERNFTVVQHKDEVHLQFDYGDEHYHGFVLAKYWLSERYRSDNFWQLAAHGFYHRMAPLFPQN
jgi:hypothetical protein